MPTWLWVVIVVAARARGARSPLERAPGTAHPRATRESPREDATRWQPTRRRSARRSPSCGNASGTARRSTSDRSLPRIRDRFQRSLDDLQADFVDDPRVLSCRPMRWIQEVMRLRGYPVDNFETGHKFSVDRPDVVANYRAGHGIAVAHDQWQLQGTEELRQAMKHYRARCWTRSSTNR